MKSRMLTQSVQYEILLNHKMQVRHMIDKKSKSNKYVLFLIKSYFLYIFDNNFPF